MFVSKAGVYPSEANHLSNALVLGVFTKHSKHQTRLKGAPLLGRLLPTRLKRLATDKHSSL
jgi:hypothetical protein